MKNGRAIGERTLLHDGDMLLCGDHLERQRKNSSVSWNRRVDSDAKEKTHFGGVAGSRRALESCRFGT
jgi:hypothetical protein